MTIQTLSLRPYQTDAVEAVYAAWAGGMKRPAVVLPTGTGKTVIFAKVIADAIRDGKRPLVLVHRDELVRQTEAKIHAAAPGVHVGVVKAGRNETDADVIIASVQTLARRTRLAQMPAVDLVIVDEAHHAAADSYTAILRCLGCYIDGGANAVGFTATMSRSDGRALGQVWQKVVYTKSILSSIAGGHLVDVRGRSITVNDLDLASVARSRGDYQEGALGEAMEAAGAGKVIATSYLEHCRREEDGTLRPGILFAPTVHSAQAFADELNMAGVPTEVIIGDTGIDDRQLSYQRMRDGVTKVLSSCMVLTEGFDLPEAEVAVIARPTASKALYVQMVGRILRPSPWTGKTEALVLDVVGNSSRLQLATLTDLSGAKARKENESLVEAAVREEKEKQVAGVQVKVALQAEHDLFGRSTSAWLRTIKQTWFIPTKEATFFLWEVQPGVYKIGRTGTHTTKGGAWLCEGESFPIEMAMSWAEQYATEEDKSVSLRTAPWRTKTSKPTIAQLGLAARLRIQGADEMTKSELSDAISIVYASRLLDSTVGKGPKR